MTSSSGVDSSVGHLVGGPRKYLRNFCSTVPTLVIPRARASALNSASVGLLWPVTTEEKNGNQRQGIPSHDRGDQGGDLGSSRAHHQ